MDIEMAVQMGMLPNDTGIDIVEPTSAKKSALRAPDFVRTALEALDNRGAIRDQPDGERSAKKAARILSAWTDKEVSEEDVWRTLIAVKMARESQGAFHADDLIDLAGYAGLLAECRAAGEVE